MDALRQGRELPGSAIILNNFEPHPSGGYRRVQGFIKYDEAAVPGTGDILGVCVAGDSGAVIACRDTGVYTSTGSGWTQRNATSLRTAGAYTRFARYGYLGDDRVVLVNGTDRPHAFNPTTNAYTVLSTAPMAADCACEFKGRMWYGKNHLLTYSAPFSENDFTPASGGGEVNVGARISGLAVWRDQLIIFTTARIMKVTGNTAADFAMSPVTTNLGCRWPDTIQEINGDLVFLAHDGLRTIAGTTNNDDTELGSVSKLVQKPLTDLTQTYNRIVSCVIRKKSQYRLLTSLNGLPPEGTTGMMAAMRAAGTADEAGSGARLEFATIKGFKATAADSWVISGAEQEMAVFGNNTGYVYQQEVGSNLDGAPIIATYQTPFLSFDDIRIRKIFRRLQAYIEAEGSFAVGCSLILDLDSPGTIQPFGEVISSSGAGSYTFGSALALFGVAVFGGSTVPIAESNLVGAGFTGSFRFSVEQECPAFAIKTLACELSYGARK